MVHICKSAADESLESHFGADAVLHARDYDVLVKVAAAANAGVRAEVHLVLPLDDGADHDAATLVFAGISPQEAFRLLSTLPLRASASEVLAQNGLSLRALSLSEAAGTGRRGVGEARPGQD